MIRSLNTAAVDVIETDESYIVKANLPGFEKDEIDIEADFETLKFTASHKEEVESKELVETNDDAEVTEVEKTPVNYLHRERSQVTLSRTMTFAKPINANEAKVTLENGVLEIVLPFSEKAKTVKLIPAEN